MIVDSWKPCCLSGRNASSRFGPTVPVVPASASVWQEPHVWMKSALPFAGSPSDAETGPMAPQPAVASASTTRTEITAGRTISESSHGPSRRVRGTVADGYLPVERARGRRLVLRQERLQRRPSGRSGGVARRELEERPVGRDRRRRVARIRRRLRELELRGRVLRLELPDLLVDRQTLAEVAEHLLVGVARGRSRSGRETAFVSGFVTVASALPSGEVGFGTTSDPGVSVCV